MKYVAMVLISKDVWQNKSDSEKEKAITSHIIDKIQLYRQNGYINYAEWGPAALISKEDGKREPVNRVGDIDFDNMLLEVKKEKEKLWEELKKKRDEVVVKMIENEIDDIEMAKRLKVADEKTGFTFDKEGFINNTVPLSTLVVIAKDGTWYDPRNEDMLDWITNFHGFYDYLDPDDVIALLTCKK